MRDAQGRAYATGRRKTSAARVWVKPGDGDFSVNGMPLADYFPRMAHRVQCMQPLVAAQASGAFDVWLTVKGGGVSGQAGAVRHGLANALARYDPFLRPVLRKLGLIQRDPRMVERKKTGQKKARRKFQWVKR
jgi:small subunit ribosomal protein S9